MGNATGRIQGLNYRYCFVLHSRTPNARAHKPADRGGDMALPVCGCLVGTDALEYDDSPLGADLCLRCFPVED